MSARALAQHRPLVSFLSALHCKHIDKKLSHQPCWALLSHAFKHTAPCSPVIPPSVIARLCHHLHLLAHSIFNQHPIIAYISLPTLHSMCLTHTHEHTHIHEHARAGGQYAERGHFINTVPEEAVCCLHHRTLNIVFIENQTPDWAFDVWYSGKIQT